ncbi:MAG: hypothetical protein M4D80_29615 [Myxococcota bacterium]|nr:hypothetical protein [Myxococcota bacterium]
MPERSFPAVRVRAVRGQSIDPFRGTPGDDAERRAPRTPEPRAIEDVVAALERIRDVRLVRAGRRFTLGRGHDVIKISFASAAQRISLDDATFEGDGNLIITVLHALLPLFGAIEVQLSSYSDLIDGHEPLDEILERYNAWWIDESLKLAQELRARDAAARPAPSPQPAATPYVAPPAKSKWRGIAFGLVMLALAIGLIVGIYRAQGAEVGEYCKQNDDCDSDSCLPREPVTPSVTGIELGRPLPPSDPSGVCTKRCTLDTDCPDEMMCGAVMSYGLGIGTRTTSCVPRAWF